jgi:hypothetical protein
MSYVDYPCRFSFSTSSALHLFDSYFQEKFRCEHIILKFLGSISLALWNTTLLSFHFLRVSEGLDQTQRL